MYLDLDSTMSVPALLDLVGESKALNSKLFSLPRMLLLSVLAQLPQGETAQYRELRAELGLNDGVLFTNLKVLITMGYVQSAPARFENETMTTYSITLEGRAELERIKNWLAKWLQR